MVLRRWWSVAPHCVAAHTQFNKNMPFGVAPSDQRLPIQTCERGDGVAGGWRSGASLQALARLRPPPLQWRRATWAWRPSSSHRLRQWQRHLPRQRQGCCRCALHSINPWRLPLRSPRAPCVRLPAGGAQMQPAGRGVLYRHRVAGPLFGRAARCVGRRGICTGMARRARRRAHGGGAGGPGRCAERAGSAQASDPPAPLGPPTPPPATRTNSHALLPACRLASSASATGLEVLATGNASLPGGAVPVLLQLQPGPGGAPSTSVEARCSQPGVAALACALVSGGSV